MRYIIFFIVSAITVFPVFSQSETTRLNDLGFEAYKKHQYDVASDLFFRAIQADNSNFYAHHNYACMLALNHWRTDIKVIISHLKQEIALNPNRMEKILSDPDLDAVRNKKEFIDFVLDGTISKAIRTGKTSADISYEFIFNSDGTVNYTETKKGLLLDGRWAITNKILIVYLPGMQKNKTPYLYGKIDIENKIIELDNF